MYQHFIPFLLPNDIPLYEYMDHILFINLPVMDIWVVSTFLVIMTNAMNICVCVFEWRYVLLGCTPQACKPGSCPVLRLKKDPGGSDRDINSLLDRGFYMYEPKVLE